MKVLLAYASRYGSTREIAEAIVEVFGWSNLPADLKDVRDVDSIDEYNAVILGSAIYMGQWMKEARQFVDRFEDDLKSRPVWIFTSGPIGDDPFPKEDPPETPAMMERTGAQEYRSFSGRLDRSKLGLGEKIVATVVRAPEGDYRNWTSIRDWAKSVAAEIKSGATTLPEPAGQTS